MSAISRRASARSSPPRASACSSEHGSRNCRKGKLGCNTGRHVATVSCNKVQWDATREAAPRASACSSTHCRARDVGCNGLQSRATDYAVLQQGIQCDATRKVPPRVSERVIETEKVFTRHLLKGYSRGTWGTQQKMDVPRTRGTAREPLDAARPIAGDAQIGRHTDRHT